MIKIKVVDVKLNFFSDPNFKELFEVVNEIGRSHIVQITSAMCHGDSGMKYTIFYEDDD